MEWEKSGLMLFSLLSIKYDSFFHHMSIFGLRTRLYCGMTVMTSRFSDIRDLFPKTEHERCTCCISTSYLDYADSIKWFHYILQVCMVAPGKFHEHSV